MNPTEKGVLANLISSGENIQLCTKRGIKTAFFAFPETQRLFDIIVYYYQEYQKTLETDSLQLMLQQSQKTSEEMKKKLTLLFEEIKIIPPSSNFSLVLDNFFIYNKEFFLKKGLNSAVDYLSEGRIDDAVKSLHTSLQNVEKLNVPDEATSGFFGEDFMEKYQDRKLHPEKYKGLMSGFPTFDGATGGLQNGTVTLIMGSVKTAKSVLIVNIAHNVSESGKRIYYHVNEGGKLLVEQRLVSCHTGIPYNHIRDGTMTPEEEQICSAYVQESQLKNNIYLDSV